MGNASIDISLRQSKAIQQQIFEKLMEGNAHASSNLTDQSVLKSVPGKRTRRVGISPPPKVSNIKHELTCNTSEKFSSHSTCEPTREEILREVARQKLLGAMQEVPLAPIISSAAAQKAQNFDVDRSASLARRSSGSVANSSQPKFQYWIIAVMASTWLVHSMAQALGGGLWNYLIAAAFDFTPMILIGAKVNPDTQKIAGIGAVSIFLIGLGLYLAPSVQTVFNEYSEYSEASQRFALDMKEYNSKRTNATSLIDSAKKTADASEKVFQDTKEKYGENSWRIASAKKSKEADFEEWKRLSDGASALQVPVAPKINNELRNAAQAIGMRIGLFAIVFLSMYVMRRLENEGSA